MEDEIDLRDYLKIIKKRIIGIIIILIVAIAATAGFSFFMPKIYEVNTSLEIGKIGKELLEAPTQLIEKIKENIYGVEGVPKMEVENPKGTSLIKIKGESKDPENAKTVLEEMNELILADHEEKIKLKKETIEKNIEGTENNIKSIQNDIELTKNKIKPIDSDIYRINNKIKFAEDEKKNLEAKVEVLEQTLVYQQTPGTQFALFDTKEKLANKKQEIENLYLSINSLRKSKEDLNLAVNSLERSIEDLNSKVRSQKISLDDIQLTKVIKAPTVSGSPIKPKPFLNMAIAAVLGLFVGILWAFAAEYLKEEPKKEIKY